MLKKIVLACAISLVACVPATPAVAAADTVYVEVAPAAPPPVIYERVVVREGYVWCSGHWYWNSVRWVWIPGRHVAARVGWRWVGPRYVVRVRRWHYVPGHWAR